jgi:flagellar hook-associated protein 3 FlgL
MRTTDLTLSQTFVKYYNDIKSQLNTLEVQVSTSNKIQEPSDSPSGIASLIKWQSQLTQSEAYSTNIDTASSFVTDTTDAMESIQSDISTVLTTLSALTDSTETSEYATYADEIQGYLDEIVSLANTQSGDTYVFGGTSDEEPYGYTSDESAVVQTSSDVSGSKVIKTSGSSSKTINLSGTDVFGTIVTQNGSIDSTTSVGDTVTSETSVYDTSGTEYTLQTSYTKTADNTYSMTYDVVDSDGNSVLSSTPAAETLVFNSSTGKLETVDGDTPEDIDVSNSDKTINFSIDLSSIKEKSGTTSLTLSENQETDIFNTLISIINTLNSGETPTDDQIQAVTDFNTRILDNISLAGDITNQLTNTSDLLSSQQTQLESLISDVQTVDAAAAATQLSDLEYLLDACYQVAADIQNNSLLDYL